MPTKRKPRHPGAVLNEEFLQPLGLSQNGLAMELRVPVTRISAIVRGKRVITADTALRLARYFRNKPEFWMSLQEKYALEVAEQESGPEIAQDVRPRED